MRTQTALCDSAEKYGYVTRILHWGMALLLAWQFTSGLVHWFLEDSAIDEFFWGTHKSVGFLLMMLIIVRVVWALINHKRRPPAVNAAALAGHLALYLLMLVVPAVAMIRQYGSGRAFEPFGLPLMAGFDESLKIQWMVDLGSNLHSLLAYLLLVLAVGHIVFAIRHYLAGERYVTDRIL